MDKTQKEKILEPYILINKPLGLTPLELIENFRNTNPNYKAVKIAYAGRLDPMASGLMILLIGEECKRREHYQNLNKEYEFEVIFGLKSDSLDILGLIEKYPYDRDVLSDNENENFGRVIDNLTGKFIQEYPIFSSKTVQGKPLFWWARENKLDQIQIPKKTVEIINLEYLGKNEILKNDLNEEVVQRVNLVNGDFRQKEIIASWEKIKKRGEITYFIYSFKANVSSGTYIRSIANEMGKLLGTNAIAWNIKRTKVGEYTL